jgi:hypothetical protein
LLGNSSRIGRANDGADDSAFNIEDTAMDARLAQSSKPIARAAAALGLALTLFSATSALALGTPEQRKACTPDVYRLCAGEIPNVRAITACLRRNRANLSEACRIVFDQAGN